jgi:D-beta-D-heptose 7-phosphate kinase/D-beta-D-heptose 1-phosphate adenosyltransferase
VLVIGDVVCDVHLVGTLDERESAPVFSTSAQYDTLGGAAGTACDLQALGCDVRLLSVVGADAVGRRTRELLRQQRIADTLVLEDAGRPTLQRTHLRSAHGHVLRLDRQWHVAPSRALSSRLALCLEAVLPGVDGILCAEGEVGFVNGDLERLLSAAHSAGCPVYVGSQGRWSRCCAPSAPASNGSVSLAEVVQELCQHAA